MLEMLTATLISLAVPLKTVANLANCASVWKIQDVFARMASAKKLWAVEYKIPYAANVMRSTVKMMGLASGFTEGVFL